MVVVEVVVLCSFFVNKTIKHTKIRMYKEHLCIYHPGSTTTNIQPVLFNLHIYPFPSLSSLGLLGSKLYILYHFISNTLQCKTVKDEDLKKLKKTEQNWPKDRHIDQWTRTESLGE